MGKPVERQNLSLSFFILAVLIAACTAWAFYDEYVSRRPWKEYQERIFAFEREKAARDLRYYERLLEGGELEVRPDPAKPEETLTVAEARRRLDELDTGLAKERHAIAKLEAELEGARIEASDTDLAVKLLRSEDDGLFYQWQHAMHEEALAQAAARRERDSGNVPAGAAALALAERHAREARRLEELRRELAERIAKAAAGAETAARRHDEARARLDEKLSARRRLAEAIEAALEPVSSAKEALESALEKRSELTQYWLTSWDSSVDRCQNCHATIDRCGFSRPHEVLSALNADGADPDKVHQELCVTPETTRGYQETADALCGLEWGRRASERGGLDGDGGRCFTDRESRGRIGQLLLSFCGPENAGAKLLADRAVEAACLGAGSWKALAAYAEDPTRRTGPDGSTWSACELSLSEQGERCVEGAAREQLSAWLGRHCRETSPALRALRRPGKACASGEDARRLSAVKPVLFDLPSWAQTHPRRGELLARHPPERFGCTSCHEGQGAQTKGVAGREFQHGHDDPYWEKPMLDLVSHEKFRPTTFGPPSSSEGVPGEWVTHQDHFVESTCAKCHQEEVNLPHAPTYSRGRQLAAELGCQGCHPVDALADFPKVGPTLTDLKEKTSPAFLSTWLSYPKAFRPRTKMPNFWPEALAADGSVRTGSPEELERRDEVAKIAAYLWKRSPPPGLPPLPVAGDPERGRRLADTVGCRGCHSFSPPERLCGPGREGGCEAPRSLTGSAARDFAPNLSNVGLKANERWLFAWLKKPSALWKGSRMPDLRLSDQEAADLTAYLMTLQDGQLSPAPDVFADEGSEAFERAAAEGERLVREYGCAGCHEIAGHAGDAKIGTDLNELGRKTVDLIDFGNAIPNPRQHSWYNFVDLKLRAPRAFRYERVDTRMPQFDLDDPEVEALMTFLKSRTGEKVPGDYLTSRDERRAALARGEQVLEYYNCKGCHVIDGEGGRIRDLYPEDELAKAPPVLQKQGWRVQPEWLFGFLEDPSLALRPWLDARMPTFPLTDDEATRLVRHFSAKDQVAYPYVSAKVEPPRGKELAEVKAMVEELKCFNCHTAGEPSPDQDRATLAPDLTLARSRLRPEWVSEWLKNPQALQDGSRMPSFFTPDDFSNVMYPAYFGGSQERQIQMLTDWVMTLPEKR